MKIGRCIAVAAIFALAVAGAADASPRPPAPYASAARIMRSAWHGNVAAQARLGFMYATGTGVPQNYFEAAKWYDRAAVQGHGGAQLQLGLLYNRGVGVPQDYVLAHMWLNLAASQAAGSQRDHRARLRDALASKMTPAELAAAQALARRWYEWR